MSAVAIDDELPTTLPDFLGWRDRQPERWEFFAGAAVMMAPASLRHTALKGNVYAALRAGPAGCRAFVDGAEVRTGTASLIPDVVVACGAVDLNSTVVAEPTVIVEILSPSSRSDDLGRKWVEYRRLPSLALYLVVAQDERCLHCHRRVSPTAWLVEEIRDGSIDVLGLSLSLDAIYAGVVEP